MRKTITGIVLVVAFLGIALLLSIKHSAPNWMSESSQPIAVADYTCDAGKTIRAAYYDGSTDVSDMSSEKTSATQNPSTPPTPKGSVMLALSDGRTMTLNQTISADGARYADPQESFVFWNKGNGAMVIEKGVSSGYKNCISKEK